MLTVVGFPRSGTHWLKAMLEHALGEPLEHTHACPEVPEGQCVLIVRDPRDALASICRASPSKTEREALRLFLEGSQQGHPEWRIGWVPYIRNVLDLARRFPDRTLIVRHEEIYAAPEEMLARIIVALGKNDVSATQIEEAVRRTNGRRCDPTDLAVDQDMGRPGKWKGQLGEETVRLLLESCGAPMVEMGYLGGKPC